MPSIKRRKTTCIDAGHAKISDPCPLLRAIAVLYRLPGIFRRHPFTATAFLLLIRKKLYPFSHGLSRNLVFVRKIAPPRFAFFRRCLFFRNGRIPSLAAAGFLHSKYAKLHFVSQHRLERDGFLRYNGFAFLHGGKVRHEFFDFQR